MNVLFFISLEQFIIEWDFSHNWIEALNNVLATASYWV